MFKLREKWHLADPMDNVEKTSMFWVICKDFGELPFRKEGEI